MSNIIDLISKVELKWLNQLYSISKKYFESVKVPSHDHEHHMRVWMLAKKLLSELNGQNSPFSYTDIENLCIAIFFHDIGMVKTLDKKHGHESRVICEAFLRDTPEVSDASKNKILSAVENHDDKEYKGMMYGDNAQTDIFSVLCVCDDLDAFGPIGVFRYFEIYTLRGVAYEDLSDLIVENVESRYDNFSKLYGTLTSFYSDERTRYEFVKNFFLDLKKDRSSADYKGARVVLILLHNFIKSSDSSLAEYVYKVLDISTDRYAKNYFSLLANDLQYLSHVSDCV